MSISTGDRIPDVTLKTPAEGGAKDISTGDFFGGKKVVLFAVPGAFTPTSSANHLPSFVDQAEQILGKGVDAIACTSVNDHFVLEAWAKSQGAENKVTMLADGNGAFASALGMELDASGGGLGKRSKRYSAIVTDGVVQALFVEDNPGVMTVTGADKILEAL